MATTIVPPHSGSMLWIATPRTKLAENQQWILEPTMQVVTVAYTVVQDTAKTGVVPVQVLNLSDQPVTIAKAQPVVRFAQLLGVADSDSAALKPPPTFEDNLQKAVNNASVTDEQKAKLKAFLETYKDVFSEPTSLGRANITPHKINTHSTPVASRAYRYGRFENEEIRRQIATMRDKDVVGPSTSPWAAPVVLARKKDGTWRFCVDYRKLNAVTVRDVYPLPRIDDALDALAGAKLFTTLDAWTGYWQIPLDEADRAKTAFITQNGLYEFKGMPFGLVNAPASFQRIMNLTLHSLTWKTCLVYLNDIIVFSNTFDEHLTRLTEVLDRLRGANIHLKLPKCTFCVDTVQYLGHIVSASSVAPDPDKIKRMVDMAAPRNVTEVRSFLNFAGYYRRFIRDFAKFTVPIATLLKKDVVFSWNDECEKAFSHIKSLLSTAPILTYPDWNKMFILQTDGCGRSLGAVLSQINDDGREHPVAYYSRLFTNDESKYSNPKKECLALLDSMRHFRPYLWGKMFTVHTDHQALKWLYNTKDTNDRLYRWFIKLAHEGYDYNVVHRPGKDHANADGMSRLMCKMDHTCNLIVNVEDDDSDSQSDECSDVDDVNNDVAATPLQLEQRVCRITAALREYVVNGLRPRDLEVRRIVGSEERNLVLDNDVLYRIAPPASSAKGLPRLQAVVPTSLRLSVLREAHDALVGGGHLGFDKTYSKITERWWWPGIYRDTRHYVESCTVCRRMTSGASAHVAAPLQSILVHETFELVGIDIVGKLSTTAANNKFILVITDHLSK